MTAPDAKRLATLTAKCPLAGGALIQTTDDHDRQVFIVSRWALCKQIATMDEVEKWLERVTGSKELA